MSRKSKREQRRRQAEQQQAETPPAGHITWSSHGNATERMPYWLPPGVTPADIGLSTEETAA